MEEKRKRKKRKGYKGLFYTELYALVNFVMWMLRRGMCTYCWICPIVENLMTFAQGTLKRQDFYTLNLQDNEEQWVAEEGLVMFVPWEWWHEGWIQWGTQSHPHDNDYTMIRKMPKEEAAGWGVSVSLYAPLQLTLIYYSYHKQLWEGVSVYKVIVVVKNVCLYFDILVLSVF